jgi:hypothetical protein
MCPTINGFTPLHCGENTFHHDWLLHRTRDMFFDNDNVDKLLKVLQVKSADLIKEEVYITRMLQEGVTSRIFLEPVVAIRNYLRYKTGSTPTRQSRVVTATACGCGKCLVAKRLYWESLGSLSHISDQPSPRRQFVANITLQKCSTPFVTKHFWMKKVFLNVISVETSQMLATLPKYAAFEELVRQVGITDQDLERLCRGKLRKSYFNLLYGARPMMLLVRVMQKGLKIHVPWHIYNDKRINKKAQPYIDRILAEEAEDASNIFSDMPKRELTIKMRDTKLKPVIFEEDLSELFIKAKFPQFMFISEYEVLPQYQDLYERSLVAFDNVIQTCLIKMDFRDNMIPWRDYQIKLAEFFEGYIPAYEDLFAIIDSKFCKRYNTRTEKVYHPCTPDKYRKLSSSVICRNLDKDLYKEIRSAKITMNANQQLVAKATANHKKRIQEGNRKGDESWKQSLKAGEKLARSMVEAPVKFIDHSAILAIEPGNLLTDKVRDVKDTRIRDMANFGVFLIARSVREEVNRVLADAESPYYFDAHMKAQWLGSAVPTGRSSGHHYQVLLDNIRNRLFDCKIPEIVDTIIKERSEVELMRNHMILAAKALRYKVIKQCQSRHIRAQMALLPPEKILKLNDLIETTKISKIKSEVGLTNGLIKKLMVMPIKKPTERERYRK